MKKRFLENLTFFLSINLLIKPIYVFGIDRVVQNTVGTEVYGSYFPLLNLVLIVQIFLDMGIENFIRKEIAHNPGLTNRLFNSFFAIKVLLIVLFIAIFSVAGLFLPQSHNEWKLLLVLLVNQAMANFILYLRANMGGLHLFKTEAVISVLDRLFMILICGALLLHPVAKLQFKIEWFVYSQSAAYLITFLISLFTILRKTGKFKLKFDVIRYIPFIRQLRPYALLVLLMAFYFRIDSVFLRFLLPDGKEQAGIYAHGFRILDFIANYALIFSFILLPIFAKMIRHKESVAPLLRLGTLTLTIPSFAFITGIIFYRVDVFELLYTEHITLSANTFMILTISFIGICISYTFGALLTANGNLTELNIMAVTAVILSIILNLILIPVLKVKGAAITHAFTQIFTIIFHVIVVYRKFQLKIDRLLIIKIVAFILFCALTGFSISKTNIHWMFGIMTITLCTLIFAYLIKLISLSFISQLISKN